MVVTRCHARPVAEGKEHPGTSYRYLTDAVGLEIGPSFLRWRTSLARSQKLLLHVRIRVKCDWLQPIAWRVAKPTVGRSEPFFWRSRSEWAKACGLRSFRPFLL